MGTLAVSAVLLILSGAFALEALKLPYTAEYGFGPGFFPIWISGAVALLSVILLVRNASSWKAETDWGEVRANLRSVAPAVLCLLFVALTLERLGFFVDAFVVMSVLPIVGGKYSVKTSLIVAAVFTICLYVLFVHLLGVPLGHGVFGF